MENDKRFKIAVTLKDADRVSYLDVSHLDETFSVKLPYQTIVVLNNGDNSWSLVSGDLDQLAVNLIGDAIEQFYKDAGW